MPREPLAPPPENGTRADRKMWRTIAETHAYVAFMPSGEFDELQAAYAMKSLTCGGRSPSESKRHEGISSECGAPERLKADPDFCFLKQLKKSGGRKKQRPILGMVVSSSSCV